MCCLSLVFRILEHGCVVQKYTIRHLAYIYWFIIILLSRLCSQGAFFMSLHLANALFFCLSSFLLRSFFGYHHFFPLGVGWGKQASTVGACPVTKLFTKKYRMLMDPKLNPTTTPASSMMRGTKGNRFTNATMVATPNVTDQDVMRRFLVACTNPILYSGANR